MRKDPVNIHHIFIDEYSFSEWGIRDEKKSLLLVSKKVGFEALEVLYVTTSSRFIFTEKEDTTLQDTLQKPIYEEYEKCRS